MFFSTTWEVPVIFTLEKDSLVPLYRQIYLNLKKRILEGHWETHAKLPSTRALSDELGVSRNTVLEAYQLLLAEGYLEAQHGSGTRVASGVAGQLQAGVTNANQLHKHRPTFKEPIIDFRSGIPALDLFPQKEWSRLYQRVCSGLPSSAFGYCSPAGIWELRVEISQYLTRTRGMRTTPEQIMITSGSTQGLSIVSSVLGKQRTRVIMEDPVHIGLRRVVQGKGLHIDEVDVDEKGLQTDQLQPSDDIAFIYVTPSHQYPMGGILPIQRRLALIAFAQQNNCYIIEDDYDGEFRYEGSPISSLYELCPERVVYAGSFSKIFAPSIRLGFLILPRELLNDYKEHKMYLDVHTDAIMQYAMAEYLRAGYLEKHILKMKRIYGMRRNFLIERLMEAFPQELEILGHAAGLNVVAHFHNTRFTEQTAQRLLDYGVKVYPVSQYSMKDPLKYSQEIILGYSHLTTDEIEYGVHILGTVLHALSTRHISIK